MFMLSIEALDKSFRAGTSTCCGAVRVLRGLALTIWPGETVALEAAAGAGKSTLLRCAAGLLRPDAGAISWFGARTTHTGVAYLCAAEAREGLATPRHGALYTRLADAIACGARLVLVDDLDAIGALERRLILHLLGNHAARGGASLLASSLDLADQAGVSRVVTLAQGAIVQRRNRSATRIAASSFASRARSRARSTYGRNFRSPQ